jgi:hypothetical protein
LAAWTSAIRAGPGSIDRLVAVALLAWALFDVPWWWRRRWPAAVLAVTAGALAVKQAAHLNEWSAGAAVLLAAYDLGAYGQRRLRQAARIRVACAALAALITLQADRGDHADAVACAMLGVALALGEITSSHRDAATAAGRHALDLERASWPGRSTMWSRTSSVPSRCRPTPPGSPPRAARTPPPRR